MKILVTGGSGFVGKNLVPRLIKEGNEVTFTIRKEIDLAKYNPQEKSLSAGKDIIIHLASFVNINDMLKNPQETISNNINSTLNLLEDIRLNNPTCLFIFLSSEKVYGNPQGESKEITEDELPQPVDPYGSSKLISEMLIKSYHSNYNLNYLILRAGNIFGSGQKSGLFIPSIITKIIEHPENVTLGNLESYRNFIYIEDLITAIVNSLNLNSNYFNQTFNLSAYNLKISDVLNEITALANSVGINPTIVQDKSLFRVSETQAKRYFLDCEKAHKFLNWHPQHQFETALKVTFDSYLKNNT